MSRKPKQETLEKRLDKAIEESMALYKENRELKMQRDFDVYAIDELVGKIAEERLKDVLKLLDPCYTLETIIRRK